MYDSITVKYDKSADAPNFRKKYINGMEIMKQDPVTKLNDFILPHACMGILTILFAKLKIVPINTTLKKKTVCSGIIPSHKFKMHSVLNKKGIAIMENRISVYCVAIIQY